ncbi:GPI mannosyltransferase 2 [Aspergillus aurantiobrunneus]
MNTASSSKPTASWLPCLLDPSQPVKSLSIAFWLWKAVLFGIIIGCPGLGYDTSSSLLPFQGNDAISFAQDKHVSLSIPLKFVRWDSIYFADIARSGYAFEQVWAFSYTYSYLARYLSSFVFRSSDPSGAAEFAVAAATLSHVAHYLSVLALYRLSLNVFGHETERRRLVCFLSAALHIISPAGAFLSAPYGESLFSFLNVTGLYIYSSSHVDLSTGRQSFSHVKLLLSGFFFAVATAVRSNGVLSGIPLAIDAIEQSYDIIVRRSFVSASVRLCFVILSGCIVALGFVVPQYLAYTAYCINESISRPWCQSLVPSIYGWVQAHYWGVGFLRYWTMSNLPLFLLASPMLLILFLSCFWAVGTGVGVSPFSSSPKPTSTPLLNSAVPLLTKLAIAQFILTIMALTSYHVQIVNRISSGYPLWYWYLACQALEIPEHTLPLAKHDTRFLAIVQVMVVYALVQAVLFGSFLPPA